MTKQQAYDPATADFIGKLATSMPPMPGSVMQEWKPAELRRALMRAVAVGPKGSHVPRFPIARLDSLGYQKTEEGLLERYGWGGCSNFLRTDKHLKQLVSNVFSGEAPKQVKRSRGFVGVFAEFVPEELLSFMRDNYYIPLGMFQWAQEVGLRPMTQYDALHIPAALPGKSPWYGKSHGQVIVPMFVPTPAKASDPKRPLTAWHADRLASMLKVETVEPNMGRRNSIAGVRAEDVVNALQNPDTIMVFWS